MPAAIAKLNLLVIFIVTRSKCVFYKTTGVKDGDYSVKSWENIRLIMFTIFSL